MTRKARRRSWDFGGPRFSGLFLTALLCSGCTINELLPASSQSLPPRARVRVLPVSDTEGLGQLYARELNRGLPTLGFYPVMDGEAASDAVLEASVDCGQGRRPARASYALRAVAGGEAFYQGEFPLKICGSALDVPAVSKRIIEGLRAALRGREAYD